MTAYDDPGNWLDGVLVVELGGRISVGACGSLLAQAGATVVFVEPRIKTRNDGKWAQRALYAAGKESLKIDFSEPEDVAVVQSLLRRAEFVLLSSDWDDPLPSDLQEAWNGAAAVCDFTAFNAGSDERNQPFTDAMIQAISGVADTSGFTDGPPVPLSVPVMEYSTAVYGAAACVAALTATERYGITQTIDIALYDCAFNSLSTFLPTIFGGKEAGRLGNGHSMAAPWNAYNACDGWVLLCSSKDIHWQRICQVMETPEYVDDPRFRSLADRMTNRKAVDSVVQAWIKQHDVDTCIERLSALDLACGSIVRLDELAGEANLHHRGMIHELIDPADGKKTRFPGTPLRSGTRTGQKPKNIPAVDAGRNVILSLELQRGQRGMPSDNGKETHMPLEDIRVIEIGQYTTAPLTGRHLATLGAEVIKVEPPSGDAAREWLPHKDGLSIFFVMSNSGKKCLAVDLKSEYGRAAFEKLIRSADVLVENLKPGSLARLGFDAKALEQINPRLVYCSISGFGNDSVYNQRPAFDTVVQAMSGFMDANAYEGTPLKAGISACDFMGGEVGLFAILAALHRRRHSGRGQFIDLSMQDIAAWITAPLWNPDIGPQDSVSVIGCKDGFVLVSGTPETLDRATKSTQTPELSRDQLAQAFNSDGINCVPIMSVAESVAHESTKTRELVREYSGFGGHKWPLLGSPMRLSKTPPVIANPVGLPVQLDDDVLKEFGIS